MEAKPVLMEFQQSTSSSNSNTVSASSTPAAAGSELTLEKAISRLGLECLIQLERIAKLLEHSIYKTKLSLCLPMLMQERQSLATVLHPQDLMEVSFIFEKYANPLNSTSFMKANALEDLEMGDYSLKHRLNPELAHLLSILDKYKELGPKVEAITQDMKLKRNTKNDEDLPVGFNYLVHLELFLGQVTIRNQTKAADELRDLLRTKKLEESNKKLVEQIKKCEDAIINEKKAFKEVLKTKKKLIRNLEFELSKVHLTSVAFLKEKMLDSDRQMVLRSRAHRVRYQMMLEEVNESREAYRHVLNKDITDELTHRHRKRKLETLLNSWTQKYDMDMAEKQAELDELCDLYEDEAAKIQDLELKLEEQDAEYQKLMKERDDEYHEELTEKMNLFIVTHAARVIQAAWRGILANRDEKKKLRKILKMRKEAEEAAEKAAEIRMKKEAAAAKKAAAATKKQARDEMKAIKKAESDAKRAAKGNAKR